MKDAERRLVAPQGENWGAFRCGNERIDRKLQQQVRRAALGLVRLHGIYVGGELQGVVTLQAGVLQAPREVLQQFGAFDEVPTIHVEVLAVRDTAHGRGYGQMLIEHALQQAVDIAALIGLKTLSLEATQESAAFYAELGFDQADPWPDGSVPMWFTLD